MKKSINITSITLIIYMFFLVNIFYIPNFYEILGSILFLELVIYMITKKANFRIDLQMLTPIFFAIYALLTGLIISINPTSFANGYLFVFQGVVLFTLIYISHSIVGVNYSRNILVALTVSILLTSILFLVKPVVLSNGRMTIDGLNPNRLADYLSFGIMLLYLFSRQTKSVIYKIIFTTLLVMFFYAIILTGTRKVIIGLIIFFITYRFFYYVLKVKIFQSRAYKITTKSITRTFIYLGLIIIGLFLISRYTDVFSRLFNEQAGDAERLYYYTEGLKVFLKNPLFGIGLNQFGELFDAYSHSTYIELLSTTGLIGTLLFLSPLVTIYKISFKRELVWTIGVLNYLIFTGFANVYIYSLEFYIIISLMLYSLMLRKEDYFENNILF